MHTSVATISSPEFINLQPLDLNPLMSKCEIKVFYLGDSRNRTVISKDVAREMAKTLRGAPIVGYYKSNDEDFADHGEQVVIDDEGIKFNCLTKPYGFVSPDAQVWFKTFEEVDENGRPVEREYMMTTGFLWTGQFPECEIALEEDGRPHSMELDSKTLKGYWSENYKNGMDFFIINDAVFSKLCILGENVEPCFEGSTVSTPQISSSFSLDDNFKNTLFTMMQDLKTVLEGGFTNMDNEKEISVEENMDEVNKTFTVENEESTEEVVETEFVASKKDEKEEDKKAEYTAEESESSTEFKKEDDDKKEEEDKKESSDEESSDDKEDEDEEDKKKKNPPTKSELEEEPVVDVSAEYAQLQKDYDALQTQYSALESQLKELQAFKTNIENAEKDKLINSFKMLSAEEKAHVVANKEKFSYDEIKKELSVIYFDKQVKLEDDSAAPEQNITTVNFSVSEQNDGLSSWVKDVLEIQKNI